MKLDTLEMSERAYKVLSRAGFKTLEEVKEFANKDANWYTKIRNLGLKTRKEVEDLFEKYLSDEIQGKELLWVPISEKLPPIGTCLIVTVEDHFKNKMELRYPVWYMEKLYGQGNAYYFGDIGNILLKDISEVIAWMPMPKPYEQLEEKK